MLWVQSTVRTTMNHALALAVERADRANVPVLAVFALDPQYPGANRRHFSFLLDGLDDYSRSLAQMGIPLLLHRGNPPDVVQKLAGRAVEIVTDVGYLRHQRLWRQQLAQSLPIAITAVETNVVVPTGTVSDKVEWSAATLRRKIMPLLGGFLGIPEFDSPRRSVTLEELSLSSLDSTDFEKVFRGVRVDERATVVAGIQGGETTANKVLAEFINQRLEHYAVRRNDPTLDGVSGLSPWIHFGHISPVTAVRAALQAGGAGSDAFIEELVVRRELAVNHCLHNALYDQFAGLPDWARKTLALHDADHREVTYSADDFEQARTHDPYWNAAQRQMMRSGTMHGYMRMYWGKKILEWSATHREGYQLALTLNDRWGLDGRDANGYTGVAWCFGRHDRPWKERPIFGMIRYMNDRGLKRKFDADAYASRWAECTP